MLELCWEVEATRPNGSKLYWLETRVVPEGTDAVPIWLELDARLKAELAGWIVSVLPC